MGAIWEILALKGPKMDLMAKTSLRGLEGQTRPLFHTVLGPECESHIKSPNLVLRGQDLAHMGQILGQNWSKIGPKGKNQIELPRMANKTTFPQSHHPCA